MSALRFIAAIIPTICFNVVAAADYSGHYVLIPEPTRVSIKIMYLDYAQGMNGNSIEEISQADMEKSLTDDELEQFATEVMDEIKDASITINADGSVRLKGYSEEGAVDGVWSNYDGLLSFFLVDNTWLDQQTWTLETVNDTTLVARSAKSNIYFKKVED